MPQVVVQRQIQQEVQAPPVYYEMPEGLPYYYYIDFGGIFLLIIKILIVVVIASAIFTLLLMAHISRKKYICLECNHEFFKYKKPVRCPACGGKIMLEDEYLKQKGFDEVLNNGGDLY
jgi:DNA-directed RNA polymerase subunit RPC12/RpoP